MQSTLVYEFQGLEAQTPVTAFCIDQQVSYAVQTIKQDTLITKCDLKDTQAIATADKLLLHNLVHVHSLSLISGTPDLKLIVSGQPVDTNGKIGAPELWWVSLNTNEKDAQPRIFKINHLESANITGTPLPEPVIGAVSALSSDRNELVIMVLDKALHLQCSVYKRSQVEKLIELTAEKKVNEIEAGSFNMMEAVFQSFKPTEKQLDPATIGSIQSIAFSNGRAIYATKSYGDQHAVSKGFWLLKNGFHDQTVDNLPANTELTGIALLGKYVYFGLSQKSDGKLNNTIHRAEKALWN